MWNYSNAQSRREDVFVWVCFGDTQVGVQVRVCVWAEFMCLCRGCVLEAFSHSRGCRTAQSECIFTDGVWMNVNTTLYHCNSTRCWSWSVCVHTQLTMRWHIKTLITEIMLLYIYINIYLYMKKYNLINKYALKLSPEKHNYHSFHKTKCFYWAANLKDFRFLKDHVTPEDWSNGCQKITITSSLINYILNRKQLF